MTETNTNTLDKFVIDYSNEYGADKNVENHSMRVEIFCTPVGKNSARIVAKFTDFEDKEAYRFESSRYNKLTYGEAFNLVI